MNSMNVIITKTSHGDILSSLTLRHSLEGFVRIKVKGKQNSNVLSANEFPYIKQQQP